MDVAASNRPTSLGFLGRAHIPSIASTLLLAYSNAPGFHAYNVTVILMQRAVQMCIVALPVNGRQMPTPQFCEDLIQ